MRDLPLACSLDAAALQDRLAEMRALGRDALVAAEPGGVLRFRAAADVRQRLERIVAAEADCCPFLDLELLDAGDEIRLTVSAPPGAEPVTADLTAAFTAPRSRS